MPDTGQKLLLVGCGKMGGAILRGIVTARLMKSITVVEPSDAPADIRSMPQVAWRNSPEQVDPAFAPDVVLIAVKPQVIAGALPVYARFKGAVFLSIAAGVTL